MIKTYGKMKKISNIISEYSGLIVRNKTQVNKILLDKAKNLKFIGRLGVGLDNINLNNCKKLKIHVQPATGMNADAVAEYVIGSSLHLIKNISLLHNETKKDYGLERLLLLESLKVKFLDC